MIFKLQSLVQASALRRGYTVDPMSLLSIQSSALTNCVLLQFNVKPLGGYGCVFELFLGGSCHQSDLKTGEFTHTEEP